MYAEKSAIASRGIHLEWVSELRECLGLSERSRAWGVDGFDLHGEVALLLVDADRVVAIGASLNVAL